MHLLYLPDATMYKQPKVALLVETARGYGRSFMRGIVNYSRLYGPWSFYVTPGDFLQTLPKMEEWGGTGIIARIETPQLAEAIIATELPCIALDLDISQLAEGNPLANVCEVRSDSDNAIRLAVEHFTDRGFTQFAFVGKHGRIWSKRREEAFRKYVDRNDLTSHIYPTPKRRRDREWGLEQKIMADWIKTLPRPAALIACNDDRGREVLEACSAAEIDVPHDIAVLGIDDDSLLCGLSNPPLSSVALAAERGGEEAAALLARMMKGEKFDEPQRIIVEPLHVVTRQSSDAIAIEDPDVASALQFIYENSSLPIQVKEVVEHVGVSRRALEIRFHNTLDRSIRDEIQWARLKQAKQLLAETNVPIHQLAELVGFKSASYLGSVFQQQYNMTLRQYRLRSQGKTLAR